MYFHDCGQIQEYDISNEKDKHSFDIYICERKFFLKKDITALSFYYKACDIHEVCVEYFIFLDISPTYFSMDYN